MKKRRKFQLRCTLRSEKIFGNWKPFKNDEKCFLFHLKSSFRSQDILIFVLSFWSCRKAAWEDKPNFEIYDVTTWSANNYNTHIAQYFTK